MKNDNINYNFDYFDQFGEMTVDFSPYLQYYSNKHYTLQFSNIQPLKIPMKNIFEYCKMMIDYSKNRFSLFEYNICDGEMPYKISFDKYNTPRYWWIILMINNIKNPFYDWPLTQQQVIEQADRLYTKIGRHSLTFYQNYLLEKNETKRLIMLPYMSQINEITSLYTKTILEREMSNS